MKKALTSVILLLAVSLCLYSAAFPVRSVRLRVDPSLYTEEVVYIEANGRTVVGTLCLPADTSVPVPAVVMLHGTGSTRDEAGDGYKKTAPAMAAAGIATLRIDFMGSGDSTESYVGYNYTSATEDAVAAMDYLRSLEEIDGDRIGIMGWSQGGTNAIHAAAHDTGFRSVVLWAGNLDMSTVAKPELYAEALEYGFATRRFDWREPLYMGLQWFEEVYATDLPALVKQINAPLLAVNGELDPTVPPSSGAYAAGLAANPASRYVIIPQADHTFNVFTDPSDRALSEAVGTTLAWFILTL